MYTNDEKRNIENLANNTVGLKDYGKKGKNNNGSDKKGFYTLKSGKTIKLSELERDNENQSFDFEQAIIDHPEVKDQKGFGIDRNTGKARSGFYKSKSGKVVSIKQLNEAITKKASSKEVNS